MAPEPEHVIVREVSNAEEAVQLRSQEEAARIFLDVREQHLSKKQPEVLRTEIVLEDEIAAEAPTEKPQIEAQTEAGIVTFDVDEETVLEIPEPLEENLFVVEQGEQAIAPEAVIEEPDFFAYALPEIDDETKEAALLWAQQWGEESVANSNPIEDEQEAQPTLVEFIPVNPEDLPDLLINLPEAKLREAAAILEAVVQTVAKLELTVEGIVVSEEVIVALEQMVERLFVCLEIDYDQAHVETLVQALVTGQVDLDFEALLEQQNEGTHERKYLATWMFAVLKQRAVMSRTNHSFLGKFVLLASFPDANLQWAG